MADPGKLATTFVSSHFEVWTKCVIALREGTTSSAIDGIYAAGIETIYHADFMKQAAEGKTEDAFIKALSSLARSSPSLVVSAAPRMLQSFVQASARSRAYASSSVTSQQPLDHSKQMRIAVIHIFGLFDDLMDAVENDAEVWRARTAMLDVLQRNSLLNTSDQNVSFRLTSYATRATDTLASPDYSIGDDDPLIECLAAMAIADIDVIILHLPRLLTVFASIVRL
jgi:hypothetical protein